MTFVNPQYLVSGDWLEEHLDDHDLRILDCTSYLPDYFEKDEIVKESGRANYQQGHIPGSAYVDILEELMDPAKPHFMYAMPTPEQITEVMSRVGVGDGVRVILYDGWFNIWAARIWWTLRYYGFDNAGVLDGGWQKWQLDGRPVSTEPASYPPTTFVPRPRPELIADRDEVLAAIDDDAVCVINALPADEHHGDRGFPVHYTRPGHIPGSVNVPQIETIELETTTEYLPAEALRQRFDDVGATRSDQVITYCGGAIAASSTALLLTMLGVEKVALYDGSMTEWGADPELPLVTGAD